MRRGRPVLGAFGGLLFGIGAAVLIQQFGLWPLDPLLAYGLPAVFLLLGVLFARSAPFGGRS
jgi:hypothetical protein